MNHGLTKRYVESQLEWWTKRREHEVRKTPVDRDTVRLCEYNIARYMGMLMTWGE